MTYTFTYTINDHQWRMYKNNRVITYIDYSISCERDNSGTVETANLGNDVLVYPETAYDEIHPTRLDGIPTSYTIQTRTDFTAYDSLSIPGDLVNWVKAHWENDSINLAALKSIVDTALDGG